MSIDFNLPTLASLKADFLTYIRDNIVAAVKMNFSGASNIPDGAIRWNATNKKFEIYTLATASWGDLATDYAITVAGLLNQTASVGEINAVCDGNTATAAELVKAADGIGSSIPRQKIVEIGDWDMDSDMTKNVAHGLDASKIIFCRVSVRDDDGPGSGGYGYPANGVATDGMRVSSWDATNVTLYRKTGDAFFDDTAFNATSYNRGWIIIDYVD